MQSFNLLALKLRPWCSCTDRVLLYTVRLLSFFGGALGRAALIFLVSASASAARKIFSERERERRSEKSGMSASASGARKIRERLILCKSKDTRSVQILFISKSYVHNSAFGSHFAGLISLIVKPISL